MRIMGFIWMIGFVFDFFVKMYVMVYFNVIKVVYL